MTDDDKVMVRFVREFKRQAVGTDMEVYGPAEEGDIFRMPADTADVLVEYGFVRRIS